MIRLLYTTGCLGVSMRETYNNPAEEQQGEWESGQHSLAVTPGLTLMLMIRPQVGETIRQLMTAGNVRELLLQNPSLIRQVLNAVYLRPELMESTKELNPNPKYEDIRSGYQETIEFFNDAYMDAVLSTYPSFEQRVKDQLELLQNQFGEEQVKIIEVALMLLIEDGTKNLTSVNDYSNIKTSHLVYQALAIEAFEKGRNLTLSAKEQEDFIKIGQALLKNTMLFEVKLQEDETVSVHPNREKHFDGLIAEAKFLQRSIAVLQNPSKYESRMADEQIDSLRGNLRLVKDRLRLEFPDRTLVLNKLIGLDADGVLGEKPRRWARHPGEPEFSMAESTGLSHQNG